MVDKFQIIMLPTKQVQLGGLMKCITETEAGIKPGALELCYSLEWHNINWEPQHLYILCDDDIRDGDYFLNYGGGLFNRLEHVSTNSKKILASTDKRITPNAWIPEVFVKDYLACYNQNVFIKEIELEVKIDCIRTHCNGGCGKCDYGAIMPSNILSDGSIIIIPIINSIPSHLIVKRKRTVIPEKVFYDNVTSLIRNLFITNINFKNWEYCKNYSPDEVKRHAQYILDKIEDTKHLINLNQDNTEIDWEQRK